MKIKNLNFPRKYTRYRKDVKKKKLFIYKISTTLGQKKIF